MKNWKKSLEDKSWTYEELVTFISSLLSQQKKELEDRYNKKIFSGIPPETIERANIMGSAEQLKTWEKSVRKEERQRVIKNVLDNLWEKSQEDGKGFGKAYSHLLITYHLKNTNENM